VCETAVCAPGYTYPADPGYWPLDEGDLSDDGEDVCGIDMGDGMPTQYYRPCVKAVGANRTEVFARSGSVVSAVLAAAKVKWSKSASGQAVSHAIPRSYAEAASHPECGLIWEAMLREMHSHADCGTWELRLASECAAAGRTPIGNQWVFDCKVDAITDCFLLWKARLVARGDMMVYLRDFTETYSGVVRHQTFRIFLAVCAMLGLILTGADVSTAYLHAPLRHHTVWMRQPRGFEETIDGEPALCFLKMALYGLKQSAREWAITVIGWLLEYGFTQCVSDRYLFMLRVGTATMFLLIWVDDIFLGHSCQTMRGDFMKAFQQRFRVKDLGLLRQALGASIVQDNLLGTVSLSLEKYISDLARRYDLFDNVQWADIPIPVALEHECVKAVVSAAEAAECSEVYGVLTGCVVFVASFARPDVAFAAHFLSRFRCRPGHVHLKLARRVLGYLSRTRALALTYRKGTEDPASFNFRPMDGKKPDKTGAPHFPVDTDHGVNRSVTGWLFMLAGAAVSWAVRGQLAPALSSTEAELYGLSTGVCDMLTCIYVLEEMGIVFEHPIKMMTDSQGASLIAADNASLARTRHIHRRWFFVRYYEKEGRLVVVLVKGANNPANFLTKAVGGKPFAEDRAYAMGLTVVIIAAEP
jgi:hypothetical protein